VVGFSVPGGGSLARERPWPSAGTAVGSGHGGATGAWTGHPVGISHVMSRCQPLDPDEVAAEVARLRQAAAEAPARSKQITAEAAALLEVAQRFEDDRQRIWDLLEPGDQDASPPASLGYRQDWSVAVTEAMSSNGTRAVTSRPSSSAT
jgi:hypothetical protein